MSASAKKKHHSVLKVLSVLSICLYLAAFLLIIYDANIGGFLFGKNYGPGAYYYTDVPGWQHVFFESPYLGFAHPVICFGFFFGWAIIMYRVLIWLNEKL